MKRSRAREQAATQADVMVTGIARLRDDLARLGVRAENPDVLKNEDFDMRMMLVPAATLALGFSLASAFAQSQPQEISQPTTNPATTSSPPGTANNQVICRPVVHQGAVMPTQDCRTKRAWDNMRFQHQQELNEVQMRGLTSAPH
ncbi:MAG TPA: hypothetical protein VGF62_05700 [Rhizomicrobium sp.]